jgi:hypothetical protein
MLDDLALRQEPLRVLTDVEQAGFMSRMIDKVKLMLQ